MSIQVVVSSTAAGVSVSGGTAVAITVGSTSASVPVTVGGGIGPAGGSFTQADADARYVNATGDSMSGELTVDGRLSVGSTPLSNSLRYLDINNGGAGSDSGSILRLITADLTGINNSSVDLVKYKNGSFVINNGETNTAASIALMVSNVERMRIASNGAVSINGSLTVAGNAVVGGGGSANIVEAATAAGFPATGASQTLYVSRDASRVYRWDSSGVYIELGN